MKVHVVLVRVLFVVFARRELGVRRRLSLQRFRDSLSRGIARRPRVTLRPRVHALVLTVRVYVPHASEFSVRSSPVVVAVVPVFAAAPKLSPRVFPFLELLHCARRVGPSPLLCSFERELQRVERVPGHASDLLSRALEHRGRLGVPSEVELVEPLLGVALLRRGGLDLHAQHRLLVDRLGRGRFLGLVVVVVVVVVVGAPAGVPSASASARRGRRPAAPALALALSVAVVVLPDPPVSTRRRRVEEGVRLGVDLLVKTEAGGGVRSAGIVDVDVARVERAPAPPAAPAAASRTRPRRARGAPSIEASRPGAGRVTAATRTRGASAAAAAAAAGSLAVPVALGARGRRPDLAPHRSRPLCGAVVKLLGRISTLWTQF